MTNKPDQNTSARENLKTMVRKSSESRLSALSGREKLKLFEFQEVPVIFGSWMVIILLASKDLRLTLKCHFSTNSARFFAQETFGKSMGMISGEQAADFIKELSNVMGGYVKTQLEKSEIFVGLSLPLLTRGFDEVFFDFQEGERAFKDQWGLRWGDEKISFSAHYEWDSPTLEIVDSAPTEPEGAGEVEFF